MENKREIKKQFATFVSRNILGMIGMSCYYVVDTFFVGQSQGADGLAALNIVSPPYYLIYAVGAMVANGSAILYKIRKSQNDADTKGYFTDAIRFAVLFSMPFVLAGIFCPDTLIEWMGGDTKMIEMGTSYMRIILLFAPLFIVNYVVSTYIRNDNDPMLAMRATLASSVFNIIADYILMFPLNLGMTGAALASGFAPIVGVSICSRHFFGENNTIHVKWKLPDLRQLKKVLGIGWAAFATETSTAVVVLVYNYLIVATSGNLGLAAYGVISNIAIFVKSVFKGISEGSQPLISEFYGKRKYKELAYLFKIERLTAVGLAVLIYAILFTFADPIALAFNKEGAQALQALTITGIRLYFISYIFGSFNTVSTGYLSATAHAKWASVISVIRGFIANVACAVVLSMLFGMNGIWLALTATELVTILFVFAGLNKSRIKC